VLLLVAEGGGQEKEGGRIGNSKRQEASETGAKRINDSMRDGVTVTGEARRSEKGCGVEGATTEDVVGRGYEQWGDASVC
jgi:hypothetical protein